MNNPHDPIAPEFRPGETWKIFDPGASMLANVLREGTQFKIQRAGTDYKYQIVVTHPAGVRFPDIRLELLDDDQIVRKLGKHKKELKHWQGRGDVFARALVSERTSPELDSHYLYAVIEYGMRDRVISLGLVDDHGNVRADGSAHGNDD